MAKPEPPAAYSPREHERRIRELLIQRFGADHKHQSFLSDHNDTSLSQLGPIYRRLLAADATLTDDAIMRAYSATSPIQTNAVAASERQFAMISTICYFRPHLTGQLLEHGLLALIASYGEQLSADDVEAFIRYHLLRDAAEPYSGMPHPQGVAWLTHTVPAIKPRIQAVLERMIARNRKELDYE